MLVFLGRDWSLELGFCAWKIRPWCSIAPLNVHRGSSVTVRGNQWYHLDLPNPVQRFVNNYRAIDKHVVMLKRAMTHDFG